MSGLRPKQLARMGVFYLEEAILDVLLDARHEGDCIGAAEIGKRTGIFRDRGEGIVGEKGILNDAIVHGVLVKLTVERRVDRCDQPNGRGGWELTDKEFETRRDDVR